MGYSSCIAHQVGSRFIQLRQEYLDICGGNHPASIVLAIMEHWANFRISRDLRAQRENEQREIGGLAPLPADGGWVYMSVRQWRDESMGFLSERDVEKALSILMELGFLERRRNPQHKWDRTYQWRLVVSAVNGAIESLPITANAEKDEYKCTYQSGKTAETLPQNSSQNALQNTPEESTLLDAVPPLPAQKHIVGSGEMTDAECQQYVEALPSGAEAMARDAPKDTPGMIEYFRQFGRKRWSKMEVEVERQREEDICGDVLSEEDEHGRID